MISIFLYIEIKKNTMKSYKQFLENLNNNNKIGGSLNENFLNRSEDNLDNLIQSFKNLIIALKDISEFNYKIDFYKNVIKNDIHSYKSQFGYKKGDLDKLNDKFKELYSSIDNDFIDTLKLKELQKDITKNFDKGNSVDINKKKIDIIFDDYLFFLDDNIDNTYKLFQDKIKKDKNYETLKDINVIRSKVDYDDFNKEKYFLQIELLKLQEWIKKMNKKVLIIFEGRDSAGKGSSISNVTKYLDPKYCRVETFGIPTESQNNDWFNRYTEVLPKDGEIVLFDRSYYVRGYIQPVMGYCDDEQYEEFMDEVNEYESKISEDTIIIKLWLSVSEDIQKLRFELRKSNPLKYWKFSKNDEKFYGKWSKFTEYINTLLKKTNQIKWDIIDADDNRKCKLDCMKKILDSIEYENKVNELVNLSKVKKYNIIFMDIDGVLIPYKKSDGDYHKFFNEENKWSKDSIKQMNKLIKELDAKVVLISSYRKDKTKKEIERELKKVGFDYELYDQVSGTENKKRGVCIKEWLRTNKNKVKNFVIIDDHRHDFKEDNLEQYSVKPESKDGFTKKDYKDAIEIVEKNDKYNKYL